MEQNMHNVPDKQDKKQVIGKVWNIAIGVLCAVILWQLFSLHAERKAIPKTPDTISQTEIKTLNLSVTTMTQIVVVRLAPWLDNFSLPDRCKDL